MNNFTINYYSIYNSPCTISSVFQLPSFRSHNYICSTYCLAWSVNIFLRDSASIFHKDSCRFSNIGYMWLLQPIGSFLFSITFIAPSVTNNSYISQYISPFPVAYTCSKLIIMMGNITTPYIPLFDIFPTSFRSKKNIKLRLIHNALNIWNISV